MATTRQFSVAKLYEDHREKLRLNWVAALGVDRQIELKEQGNYGADVIGHLNLIHPERLQVIGEAEQAWGMRVTPDRLRHQIEELLSASPPALIVADGLEILPFVLAACETTQTPLFASPKPCSAVIDLLRIYLSRRLADTLSVHGVFMDVFGMGVLVTGDSGVGKSELALELISRGHGLVADDVVELACIAPTTIEGRSPGMLRDYLEVRGLGLLNIRTIFGETASRRKRLPPPAPGGLRDHRDKVGGASWARSRSPRPASASRRRHTRVGLARRGRRQRRCLEVKA